MVDDGVPAWPDPLARRARPLDRVLLVVIWVCLVIGALGKGVPLLITSVVAAVSGIVPVSLVAAVPVAGMVVWGIRLTHRVLGAHSVVRSIRGHLPGRFHAVALVWSLAAGLLGFTMVEGEGTLVGDPLLRSLFEAHPDSPGEGADAAGRLFGVLLPYGAAIGLAVVCLTVLVAYPMVVRTLVRSAAAALSVGAPASAPPSAPPSAHPSAPIAGG